MRNRIGRPRFMQSFAAGGAATPFVTNGTDIVIVPGGGIESTNVQDAIMELDAEKVAKAGDTMTGFLTLHSAPTADMHAANRRFVTDAITAGGGYTDEAAQDACAAMIKNGTGITWAYDDVANTLTPTVTVSGGVTQSYVDTQDALRVLKAGDTMTGHLSLPTSPGAANAVRKDYVDTYVDTQDALKVSKAGDTMSGFLTLHADPDAAMKAATKQYVDSKPTTDSTKVLKAGDTMTGDLTINKATPAIMLNRSSVAPANIIGQSNGLNRWRLILGDGTAETGANAGSNLAFVNYDDVGGQITAPLNINRATGATTLASTVASTSPTTGALTVTGGLGVGGAVNLGSTLTLSANPTAALEAAPKQYVDSRPVGICFPFSGKPVATFTVFATMCFAVTVPSNLTGTVGFFNTASTGAAVFTLYKVSTSGTLTSIGTITTTAGNKSAVTLAGAGGAIAAGESLALAAPATQDTTLSDLSITIQVTRA